VSQVGFILLSVLLAMLAERAYSAPRDVRRNEQRIQRRDEDLWAWIAKEDEALRSRVEKLALRVVKLNYPEVVESSQIEVWGPTFYPPKKDVLNRFRDQLQDTARVLADVEASEQLHHRIARRILRRPLLRLDAPRSMREVVQRWEGPITEDEQVIGAMARAREIGQRPLAQARRRKRRS
jgi:hypothetical protein